MATNAEKLRYIVLLLLVLSWSSTAKAQTPPSETEVSQYTGIMGGHHFMLLPSRDTTK